MNLATLMRSILSFFALHFCSLELISKKLEEQIEVHGFEFFGEMSGRVALYKLAQIIHKKTDRDVALIPDYICNVVNTALEKAGFELLTYSTNEYLEPDVDDLMERLRSDQVGLLLTASVFGSSALLEELKLSSVRDLILQNNIHVIVDLCQDIDLITLLPSNYGENLSAIISFNDKSFLGVMGGGILSKLRLPKTTTRMSCRKQCLLYKQLFFKVFFCLKSKLHHGCSQILRRGINSRSSLPKLNFDTRSQYEYSYCENFPYTFELYAMTKLQIIMALIGLSNRERLRKVKQEFIDECPCIRKTSYFETSAYLIVDCKLDKQRKVKPSYGMHYQPDHSQRPALKIVHNKGFCDEV